MISELDSKITHTTVFKIAYDDGVNILQSSGFVENKTVLEQIVNSVESRGSTNLSGGMLEGFTQVLKTYEDNSVNRVLLLSDGLANRGITNIKKL
ncbi:MAG: Ca-activated chloride channel family protein [Maribacter sp.]